MTRISIRELGNDVATSKFDAILDDGTSIEAEFLGNPQPDEYAFLVDGKLEVLPKATMDEYYLKMLDLETQSAAETEGEGGVYDNCVGDDDDAEVIDDTAEEHEADDIYETREIHETEGAGDNVEASQLIEHIAITPVVYGGECKQPDNPEPSPSTAPTAPTPTAPAPIPDVLTDRVQKLEEEIAEHRKLMAEPDTVYAFERIVEALHDAVLHESQKTMDMVRNMVGTMLKVYREVPADTDASGKDVNSAIVLDGRNITPADIPNLSRGRFFDVMSRLMVDYHQMRSSHLRRGRSLGESQEIIKRKTAEIDSLQRQLKTRDHEIENLRSNRQGLSAGEAQDLIDCVIDADRRASTLAERMAQYSEPEDAYVLWLRTGDDNGVYLGFDKETKSVEFYASIAAWSPKSGRKMLMSKNELENSLPIMFDWIERSLLSPAGRQLGFKNPKEFTLVPMRVMYRNIKEIKLSLVDSKVKVDVAKQVGPSPMPIKDMQIYLQAPSMRGLTIEKFRKRREETEPAPAIEDVEIKPVEVAAAAASTITDDIDELVDDLGEEPARKPVQAAPAVARKIEDETEEDTSETVEPEEDTRSTIARLSSKLARLRNANKAAAVVQSSTAARTRNIVSRFAPKAAAPAAKAVTTKRKRR